MLHLHIGYCYCMSVCVCLHAYICLVGGPRENGAIFHHLVSHKKPSRPIRQHDRNLDLLFEGQRFKFRTWEFQVWLSRKQ